MVHPADIPTTNKEKALKTDAVDSEKIAWALKRGELTGIYIKDKRYMDDTNLMRLRQRFITDLSRQKNKMQMAGEEVRTRGPKNMLDQLKDAFTHEDAQTIRIREHKKKSNPAQMLCTWIDRGYITRDEDGVYHKTPTYLKRKKVA